MDTSEAFLHFNVKLFRFFGLIERQGTKSYIMFCTLITVNLWYILSQFSRLIEVVREGGESGSATSLDILITPVLYTIISVCCVQRFAQVLLRPNKTSHLFKLTEELYSEAMQEEDVQIREMLLRCKSLMERFSKVAVYGTALMDGTNMILLAVFPPGDLLVWTVIPGKDMMTSPYFEFAAVYQVVAGLPFVSVCFAVFTNITLSLTIFAGYLMKVVRRKLEIACDKERPEEMLPNLMRCANFHQKALNYARTVNSYFAYSFLIEFPLYLGMYCFSLMVIITNENLSDFVVQLFTPMLVLVYVMAPCICGEFLQHQAVMVAEAAYNTPWYLGNKHCGKLILMMIQRAQQSVHVSVGNVFQLNIEFYMTITSVSYKAFTLLQTNLK